MNDLELTRLYLLYKAGSVQDGRKNSDLLQVAKATASDLTEEEFRWLSGEVDRLGAIRESQANEKRTTAGNERVGEKQWNVWQSAKSSAMTSKDYQERLWELPDLVRSDKPWMPTRLADGNPIDLDPNDPDGSQERLKSQPYSQVKHDPRLRDAWHAAQSGKLADMLRGGDVWQAYTDPNLLSQSVSDNKTVRSSLSAPLRSLLSSIDRGELDARLQMSGNAFGRDLPTHAMYKEDPNKLVANLMGPDSASHQRTYITAHKADATRTSMPFSQVMQGRKEEDVRRWVHEVREHHEKTVRQNLVDYQIKGYRPNVAAAATTALPTTQPVIPFVVPPQAEKRDTAFHPSLAPTLSSDAQKANVSSVTQNKPTTAPFVIPPPRVVLPQLKPDSARMNAAQSATTQAAIPSPPIQSANNQSPSFDRTVVPTLHPESIRSNTAIDAGTSPVNPTSLDHAEKSSSKGLDMLQMVLDAVGVADPTPIADGINAGISLVRAFNEPENAGTHVGNAAISAVGMVPYIGDFAKLAKYGRKGAKAASHAGTSTANASGHASGHAATQGPNVGSVASSGNSGGAIPPTPNGTSTPGPGPSGGNPSNSGNSGVLGNFTANWILPAIAAAQKQLQPDQYSGNQFDSATSTVDRFQSAVDVFVPKWSSLGVAISSVTSAFNSWLGWFKKIESAGAQMLEQNKMLAQYNGNLAGAYAALDQGRFNRDVQRSDDNGGALGRLANEQNRFEDTRQKLFGPFETLQINLQTHLTRFGNNLLKIIDNSESITEMLRDAQKDNGAKVEARNALEFSMWERGLVQNAKVPNKLNRK